MSLDLGTPADGRPRVPLWAMVALLLAAAFVALLGYGMVLRDREQIVDVPAPDFVLTTFDGETLRISDLRGRPVILNFWASWCIECDKEMALLEATHRRYDGEVVFVGVDYLDTEAKGRAYLAQYDITYPNVPDRGGQVSADYRIRGVPETFFIDRDGLIQGVQIGPLDQPTLEGWIARLRDPAS